MARLTVALFLCFVSLVSHPLNAEDVSIVLWNGRELFTVANVTNRADDLKKFAEDTKPDILLIDEVCSLEVVKSIRDVMRLDGYHVACSDFNQRDDQKHASFEVGIISRFPLTRVVEYDQTPDNAAYERNGEPNEVRLTADPVLKLGVREASVSRGFLWARIASLKLTICLTHLKSSYSSDEHRNAMKREYVAAAMALSVLDDVSKFPGYTCIVAGDLNVGAEDKEKNGTDLDVDSFDGDDDRFDETHAILGGGLIQGLKMSNLCIGIGETYDDPRFVGGPIDCIYVHGAGADDFSHTAKTEKTYGSDHFAVITKYKRDSR